MGFCIMIIITSLLFQSWMEHYTRWSFRWITVQISGPKFRSENWKIEEEEVDLQGWEVRTVADFTFSGAGKVAEQWRQNSVVGRELWASGVSYGWEGALTITSRKWRRTKNEGEEGSGEYRENGEIARLVKKEKNGEASAVLPSEGIRPECQI